MCGHILSFLQCTGLRTNLSWYRLRHSWTTITHWYQARYQESVRMQCYIFTAVCVNMFHSVWFVIFRFAFLLFVLGQSPVECWQVSLRVQYICPRQITIRAEQIFAHFQDKSYIGNVVHDIWYCMVFFHVLVVRGGRGLILQLNYYPCNMQI